MGGGAGAASVGGGGVGGRWWWWWGWQSVRSTWSNSSRPHQLENTTSKAVSDHVSAGQVFAAYCWIVGVREK